MLAMFLAAGCGATKSKTTTPVGFKPKLQTFFQTYDPVGNQLNALLIDASSMSNQQLANSLQHYADEYRNAYGELTDMHPPAADRPSFMTYASRVGMVQTDLSRLAGVTRSSTPQSLSQPGHALVSDLKAAASARRALQAKLGIVTATS